MVLTSAQLNRIRADKVQIFAGNSASAVRGAGLTIGTLNVDVSRIRSALELYAGRSTDVTISGAVAPTSGATNTALFRIGAPNALIGDWTPRSIRIIADTGGSIGVATTTSGRTFAGVRAFGAVELNAADAILIGYQSFIDKLATARGADVAALVKTMVAPQGPNGPAVLLTAGSLTLRAGKIAQQDTSTTGSLTRTGIYLTHSLQLGRTSPGAAGVVTPDFIELNGAINNGSTVLANENVALSNLVSLSDGVTPRQYYRLNNCVILQQGACTASGGTPDLGIGPDRIARLQLLDRQDAGVTEDPTVASATNEEIWRDPE
jgi:hypothetical protein